jgi:uncharacterized membrane protein
MRIGPIVAALLLTACGSGNDGSDETNNAAVASGKPAAPVVTPQNATGDTPKAEAGRWDIQSSGEGAALALLSRNGKSAIRLFCPAGRKTLLVNVPEFRPIGSEERLSFGSGGEVAALVADTRGDRQRGGVSGTGAIPDNLAALIGGAISASYGAQTSGPHPAPPQAMASAFVSACGKAKAPPPLAQPRQKTAGACLMQGEERLQVTPLRAVGTEPFWGARIAGRCVTYSHPEDQAGTRIWTRYSAGANGGGTWSGALGGRLFELRTRPQPGCSDGMSDKRYPIAVTLKVGGEERTGCAEPL